MRVPWSTALTVTLRVSDCGLKKQSSHHTPHALTLLASLASTLTRSPLACASHPASRLLSARFARRLASAALLRSRFARASPACFALCSLRSEPAASLHASRALAPLIASPGLLLPSLRSRRFSCLLAPLVAQPAVLSLARQLACCSLRSLPRLPLASLASDRSACCSLRSPSTCCSSPASLAPAACASQHSFAGCHAKPGACRLAGSEGELSDETAHLF